MLAVVPFCDNQLAIHPCLYLVYCFGGMLVVRYVLVFFKVQAIKDGELRPKPDDPKPKEEDWSRYELAWTSLCGFCNRKVNDYWLGAIIGLSELAVFPFLMHQDRLEVIGGWLAIKTAGQWGMWERSRTAFNRFLLGNLLNLGVSYFVLLPYVL